LAIAATPLVVAQGRRAQQRLARMDSRPDDTSDAKAGEH
jgi:hypothetical protein